MGKPRIFVSYAHEDDAFARRLVSDLQQAGAEVWYDVSGIDYGDFMGRIDEALRQCEWLVLVLSPAAIGSQYVKMEVNAGLHRMQQGKMRAVIPVLAAPCPPDAIPALWDMLHRYDATQDYTVAVSGLRRAVGLSPQPPTESVNDLMMRGNALSARKQYTQAIPLFERATRQEPDNFDAWANLGRTHGMLAQWQEGLAAYERALSIQPNDAGAWSGKGTALFALNRYEEAVAAYEQALVLDPRNADAWWGKVVSLRALGREAEAQDAERQARELDE